MRLLFDDVDDLEFFVLEGAIQQQRSFMRQRATRFPTADNIALEGAIESIYRKFRQGRSNALKELGR